MFALPGGTEWILILLFAAIVVLPFWKICSKAGFPPWISLAVLIPMAKVVFVYWIAFVRWPIIEQLEVAMSNEASRRS
jgi:hypothetical protein